MIKSKDEGVLLVGRIWGDVTTNCKELDQAGCRFKTWPMFLASQDSLASIFGGKGAHAPLFGSALMIHLNVIEFLFPSLMSKVNKNLAPKPLFFDTLLLSINFGLPM